MEGLHGDVEKMEDEPGAGRNKLTEAGAFVSKESSDGVEIWLTRFSFLKNCWAQDRNELLGHLLANSIREILVKQLDRRLGWRRGLRWCKSLGGGRFWDVTGAWEET